MPPNGTAGLARSRVSGSRRWPLPPARTTTATLLRSMPSPRFPGVPGRLFDFHLFDFRKLPHRQTQMIDVHIRRTDRRDRDLDPLLDQVPPDVDLLNHDPGLLKDILQMLNE